MRRWLRAFLVAETSFKLVHESLVTPSAEGFDRDGAYAAVLMRKS